MTLYERILGDEFSKLSPLVQKMHRYEGIKVLKGSVDIERGASWVAKVLSTLMRLPKSQTNAFMQLKFTQKEEKEIWARTFGSDTFTSSQYEVAGQMVEKMGLVELYFDIYVEEEALVTCLTSVTLLGLKVPQIFSLDIVSKEEALNDEVHFTVKVTLPRGGKVIEYFGQILDVR